MPIADPRNRSDFRDKTSNAALGFKASDRDCAILVAKSKSFSAKPKKGIKTDGFQNGKFVSFKTRHSGTRLFWCPFGSLFSRAHRGIKTDGYQNGKFM